MDWINFVTLHLKIWLYFCTVISGPTTAVHSQHKEYLQYTVVTYYYPSFTSKMLTLTSMVVLSIVIL